MKRLLFVVLMLGCRDGATKPGTTDGTETTPDGETIDTETIEADTTEPTETTPSETLDDALDVTTDETSDTTDPIEVEVDAETSEPEVFELHEWECEDLIDQDGDGFTDCDDTDCNGGSARAPSEICTPSSGPLGAPCAGNVECSGPLPVCFGELLAGYPSGACSRWCDTAAQDCGSHARCVGDGPRGHCAPTCGEGAACRAEYDCVDGVCVPGCDTDGHCSLVNTCVLDVGATNSGTCILAERCDQPGDEDGDAKVNCEDEACAALPACDTGPTCSSVVPLLPAGMALGPEPHVIDGDTTGLGGTFAGSCTGGYGGRELKYSVTPGEPGQTGVLELSLVSAHDLGLYARKRCGDAASEVGCVDAVYAGETEHARFVVEGGQSYVVIVDARGDDDAGPFTLTARWLVDVCGDGAITGGEGCDGGNATPGDGCSASCQPELDTWCAGATTLGTEPVAGDTGDAASVYFDGSCGWPDTREDIHRFTAPADGFASLFFFGGARLTLYVRSDCADPSSELGCMPYDNAFVGQRLRVPVTAGTTYWVFVDSAPPRHGGVYQLTLRYD